MPPRPRCSRILDLSDTDVQSCRLLEALSHVHTIRVAAYQDLIDCNYRFPFRFNTMNYHLQLLWNHPLYDNGNDHRKKMSAPSARIVIRQQGVRRLVVRVTYDPTMPNVAYANLHFEPHVVSLREVVFILTQVIPTPQEGAWNWGAIHSGSGNSPSQRPQLGILAELVVYIAADLIARTYTLVLDHKTLKAEWIGLAPMPEPVDVKTEAARKQVPVVAGPPLNPGELKSYIIQAVKNELMTGHGLKDAEAEAALGSFKIYMLDEWRGIVGDECYVLATESPADDMDPQC